MLDYQGTVKVGRSEAMKVRFYDKRNHLVKMKLWAPFMAGQKRAIKNGKRTIDASITLSSVCNYKRSFGANLIVPRSAGKPGHFNIGPLKTKKGEKGGEGDYGEREKQRLQRGYDFTDVCHWFAKRSDLILLLFDAHKLDISDEFKRTIEKLKGMDDKIRCVLNKADAVDEQKLMRIYGALMWSMGKIVQSPEVMRVFIGSFWDQPLDHDDCAKLFEAGS